MAGSVGLLLLALSGCWWSTKVTEPDVPIYVAIDSCGTAQVDLYNPFGVAVAGDGTLYVSEESNNRLHLYKRCATSGTYAGTQCGAGVDSLCAPRGIAVDKIDDGYIADYGNDRVLALANGLHYWWEHNLSGPSGIACDTTTGRLYVAGKETNGHCITVLSSTGAVLNSWGRFGTGDGEFRNPLGIALDGHGSVLISDYELFRVQVFRSDGTFVKSWGSKGQGRGEFNGPSGIVVDRDDRIYVVDQGNHRVQVFDPSHNYLTEFGSAETGPDRLPMPVDIAVDANGDLLVTDEIRDQVIRFRAVTTLLGGSSSR
jgi:DNA-binding beta-propeller fold protein YncE